MFGLKETKKSISNIDKFLNGADSALIIFKEAVKNYLYLNKEEFTKNMCDIAELQTNSNILRREIELQLHRQPTLVRSRGDIMRLLEQIDHIIAKINKDVVEFEIEMPNIPSELNGDFVRLAELSALSVESAVSAAKTYFVVPDMITDKIHRVYFYEREVNKQAQTIKRNVFHNMNELKLSEKFHLRYFTLHIEELSQAAEKLADHLSIMAVKRKL